jgi:toxin HigB-1
MRAKFRNKDLERLESDATFQCGYAPPIVRAFRKVMNVIRNAKDERDLYAMRSLRFEKLQGARAHQRSMRLNDQWRLILEIETDENGNTVIVVDIEDYH